MIVYVTFKINQDEISKTICIQKKLEFNTCNGRCELQKSYKKLEDNEKKLQNNLKEKTELVYTNFENTTSIARFIAMENRKSYFSKNTQKTVAFSESSFRPPAFI